MCVNIMNRTQYYFLGHVNRRFPEITGEIIRKSEAPAVGHHSRYGLDLYTGIYIYILVHDFTMEAAVEKRWSVTVSDLQAWTYTILDCQMRTMREKHFFFSSSFFRVLRSFWWGHLCCARLEWRTDWIDCERSLFTPCSRLRRNVKNYR